MNESTEITPDSERTAKRHEFFNLSEVAMLRFTEMCFQSLDPESMKAYRKLCEQLIETRNDLRSDCFDRIHVYLCPR